MPATPRTTLSRPRRLLVALLLLAGFGVGAWRAAVHVAAAARLSRARDALTADDPAAARALLAKCLATWPDSGEANFLAAQAARRDGDLPAAQRHLDEATRLNWSPDGLVLERALLRGSAGDVASNDELFAACLRDGHPESPQILGVLVPAYMAEFRWLDAAALAKQWTDLKPASAKAWALYGEILERLRRKQECLAALREAVRLNPADRKSRVALVRMLLEVREPAAEAESHVRELDSPGPGDPVVRTLLALCREAQGQPDEAAAILDRVIADHPPDAKTLHARGRLEMNRGRPAAALPFLRRATEVDAPEVDYLYSLFQCLQQAGTPAEADAAGARWKQAEADLKRVAELARLIAASPGNAELRREMGELFLRNGRSADGVRWLESALRADPANAAARAALDAHRRK